MNISAIEIPGELYISHIRWGDKKKVQIQLVN
jgi:hypothetical protein